MAALLSYTEDTQPSELDASLRWKEKKPTTGKSDQEEAATPTSTRSHSVPERDGKEIISLAFDQVNNNADELVELRGEGRYFGVTDPDTGDLINAQQSLGRICDNCHKRGHVRSKCKAVICHKCGVEGDHYESQCPTTVVCARCGERGHIAGACKSKHRKKQYCQACDSFNHGEENCPSIWRSYLTQSVLRRQLPASYCYNCGEKNHYGDECMAPRTSRIPNGSGSAFSGLNLPRELRPAYFGNSSNSSSKNYSANNEWSSSKSYYNKSYKDHQNSKLKLKLPAKSFHASRSGFLPKSRNLPVGPSRSGVIQARKKGANFEKYY